MKNDKKKSVHSVPSNEGEMRSNLNKARGILQSLPKALQKQVAEAIHLAFRAGQLEQQSWRELIDQNLPYDEGKWSRIKEYKDKISKLMKKLFKTK